MYTVAVVLKCNISAIESERRAAIRSFSVIGRVFPILVVPVIERVTREVLLRALENRFSTSREQDRDDIFSKRLIE